MSKLAELTEVNEVFKNFSVHNLTVAIVGVLGGKPTEDQKTLVKTDAKRLASWICAGGYAKKMNGSYMYVTRTANGQPILDDKNQPKFAIRQRADMRTHGQLFQVCEDGVETFRENVNAFKLEYTRLADALEDSEEFPNLLFSSETVDMDGLPTIKNYGCYLLNKLPPVPKKKKKAVPKASKATILSLLSI